MQAAVSVTGVGQGRASCRKRKAEKACQGGGFAAGVDMRRVRE
jgi:hypothetical protein